MNTESKVIDLGNNIVTGRIFDAPGQLLVWAADNYPKVAKELSVVYFSSLIINKITQLEGSEEIMKRFVKYVESMHLKPPKYSHGLHFKSCWYLSRFVEDDLKHRANSH